MAHIKHLTLSFSSLNLQGIEKKKEADSENMRSSSILMHTLASQWEIQVVLISLGQPQSNGQAKKMIQTINIFLNYHSAQVQSVKKRNKWALILNQLNTLHGNQRGFSFFSLKCSPQSWLKKSLSSFIMLYFCVETVVSLQLSGTHPAESKPKALKLAKLILCGGVSYFCRHTTASLQKAMVLIYTILP